MANTIAQLAVKLGLETADFTQGLAAAQKGLENFAEKIKTAGELGVAAFVGMTYKALEFSNRISDLSDANEIAVEKILALSEALNLTGGAGENAGKILASFTTKIDSAAEGGKAAQDSFKRIGISLQDIGKMSNEQLFDKTINNLAKIPDVVQRNAVAFELLGKGIRGISITKLQEEMSKGTESFKEYANAIIKAGDLHDKLEEKTTITMLIFTKEILPTLNAMFDSFNSKGGAAEFIFDKLKLTMLGAWEVAGKTSLAFQSIGASWDLMVGNIKPAEFEKKMLILENSAKQLEGKIDQLKLGYQGGIKPKDDFAGRATKAAKDAEADKQKNMLYTASLISDEYQRQVNFSMQQLKTRDAMVGMTNDEKRVQEAINQQLDSTSKKIDEITKQREAASGRNADGKVLAEYDAQIAKVKEIGEESSKMAEKIEKASIVAQRTFSFGWNKSWNQFKEDAYNSAKEAEDIFASVTNSMTNALDTFVTTGKFNFADFTKSILADIVKIEARMLMMKAITGIGNYFGGLMGSTGNAGGASEAGGAYAAEYMTAATGGTVDGPTIVGENGPELFIPGRSGSVIPNNTMAGVMGGGGTTYNGTYIANMSAIDTQSALSFIAKNQNSIWAANQAAQRSLPQSR